MGTVEWAAILQVYFTVRILLLLVDSFALSNALI